MEYTKVFKEWPTDALTRVLHNPVNKFVEYLNELLQNICLITDYNSTASIKSNESLEYLNGVYKII